MASAHAGAVSAGAVAARGEHGAGWRTLTEPVVLSTCRSMTAMLEHTKARPTAASTIAIALPPGACPTPSRQRLSLLGAQLGASGLRTRTAEPENKRGTSCW